MISHAACFLGISLICMTRAAVLEKRAVLLRHDNYTQTTSRTTALHVGDYVAAGLDLATRSNNLAVSTSSIHPSAISTQGYDVPSNHTTLEDQCWNSWAQYWSLSTDPPTTWTTYTSGFTYTDWPSLVAYTTFEVETTVTTGMGNFPTKTYVTTVQKESAIYTEIPISSVQGRTVTKFVSPSITPPPCSLPSYVPQCQSSWSSFIAAGSVEYNVPPCAQASISGGLCQTFRSNWLERQSAIVSGKAGMQWDPDISNGTTVWPSNTTHYIWPTTSQLAPGCTVGCMSCRVSGSRVKVLHWPPQTTSWRNGTFVAASTANVSQIVTTVTEGVTLTSPTVYISFDKLSASNSCSVIGTALSNIIVAITNSATLSSLYGWDRYYGRQQTASFNFTDLYVTPVPDDIYMSQPRCVSSSVLIGYSCLPMGDRVPLCASIQKSGFNCPRTLPYEPVLAMPAEVRHLQPEWNDCVGGLYGVYDPPLALHAAASMVVPTAPGGVASTTAQATQEPITATSVPASPSPQVSSPPAPTQAISDTERSSTAISQQPDHGSAGQPSLSTSGPASTSHGGAASASSPSSNGNGPNPPQHEATTVGPASKGDSVATPAPTDALGVLTQALSQTTGNGAAVSSRLLSQAPQSLPVVIVHTTGAVSPSLASGNSAPPGGAYFQYNPAPSVLFTFSGQPGAVVQSGTAVILHEPTRIATFQPGETITKGSQTLVLNTGGLVVGTTTIPIAAMPNTPAPVVVLSAGADTYTVQSGPSGAVVAVDGIEATLVSGGTTRLNGHTIAAGQNGHIIVDGSTHTLPQPTADVDEPSAVSWTAASETYIAVSGPNGIVLVGPSTTATLSSGAATTFAGQPISAIDGGAVIVNDTTLSLSVGTATALDIGNEVALPLEGTTLTIVDGSQTVLDGTSYAVPSSGGAVIVHGNSITSTVLASSSTTESIPVVVTTPPTISTSAEEGRPTVPKSGGTRSTADNVWMHGVMGALLIVMGHINL